VQEAAAVAEAQAARARVAEAEARFQDAETQHRVAQERQRAAERVWSQLCSALPLGEAPTIRELQTFLAAREKVIDARQASDLAQAAEMELVARHSDWAARLAAVLTQAVGASLVDLLALADKRLADRQEARQVRATLQARREAAEKALAEAQNQQRQAVADLADWQQDWAHAMRDLGRPAEEDPQVTEDVLQVLAELEQAQKDFAALAGRIAGMGRDITQFEASAAALAARLAPDLDHADRFELVGTLRLRLQQARELARQRDLLKQQSAQAATAAASAERELANHQARLTGILSVVGADTVETAEQLLLLAAERAHHAANLLSAEAKLTEAGDLRPLAELRREIAAVSADEIPGRIDGASHRRKEALAAAQAAAASASALAQQMHQAREATAATDAAADQQAAVASIGRVLEEALVHHLAAEMLDRALVAVERDSEPAMLRRIGELFSRLTLGVYTKVLTEPSDDNVTRLSLLQRDFPDEHQSVSQLSEGTRDQLFLALRLAAIEDHAMTAPPLPFIGDDILQTFDDDRAVAAMGVLREISHTVQVILLTHHRHVLDLAARLPAGSVHVCGIGTREPVPRAPEPVL
ncbi:MAG TPA: hypothetical protein VGM32_20870, partial [Rhodopila sp.]